MKPHIYLVRKIWLCSAKQTVTGMGYTPTEAYDDWLLLALKA